MKNFSILLTLVLAALIAYGGAGVNYVTYCCSHCQSVGIERMIEKKCCETEKENEEKHDSSLNVENKGIAKLQQDKKCGIHRINFLWKYPVSQKIQLLPVVLDLLSDGFSCLFSPALVSADFLTRFLEGEPPDLYSPRDYLSFLTLLLI